VSDEPVSLSFEQQAWVTVSLEIETELLQGYTGDIVLHCLDGVVQSYHQRAMTASLTDFGIASLVGD